MRTKDEIRAAMRARRRALTAAQRAAASEAVSAALLARADVRTALAAKRPFAVYLAAPHELDLAPFVAALWAADVTVAVPCWDAASARYVLGAYDNTTPLVEGASRIREPAEVRPIAPADIGVWIVPGLAATAAAGTTVCSARLRPGPWRSASPTSSRSWMHCPWSRTTGRSPALSACRKDIPRSWRSSTASP